MANIFVWINKLELYLEASGGDETGRVDGIYKIKFYCLDWS
jgi:hypothetical protein